MLSSLPLRLVGWGVVALTPRGATPSGPESAEIKCCSVYSRGCKYPCRHGASLHSVCECWRGLSGLRLSRGGAIGQRGAASPGLSERPHDIRWCNELITFVLYFVSRRSRSAGCVCVCVCVCVSARACLCASVCLIGAELPASRTQEMEMNHGRQIKRMARAHHILLKTGR